MTSTSVTMAFFVGAVLIAVYGVERFNTPLSNRSSTTALRYYCAATAYVLVFLLTYVALYKMPALAAFAVDLARNTGLLPEAFKPLVTTGEGADVAQARLYTTVVVAMLLSVVVPKIPGFSRLDEKLRATLQTLAAIPFEAARVSREIQEFTFVTPTQMRPRVEARLADQGFPLARIPFENADAALLRWVQITALVCQLDDWLKCRDFAGFAQTRRDKYDRLNARYQTMSGMAANCIDLMRQCGPHSSDSRLRQAAVRFRASFLDETDHLLGEICDFVSHGLLQCQLREGSRCRTLTEMGFVLPAGQGETRVSLDAALLMGAFLFCLMLPAFIVFGSFGGVPEHVLLMTSMIVTIYCVAGWAAVWLREMLGRSGESQRGIPPVGRYLLAGLLAVLLTVPISVFFKTLLYTVSPAESAGAPWAQAWSDFLDTTYPYQALSFVTALGSAVLLDVRWRASWPSWVRHLASGSALAFALAATAGLVHWWLPDARAPALVQLVSVSIIAGLLTGILIPALARRPGRMDATIRRTDTAEPAGPPELAEARAARRPPASVGDTAARPPRGRREKGRRVRGPGGGGMTAARDDALAGV